MVQPVVPTTISLSSCPKRSSVYHSLSMSSLVISAPTAYLSTTSKLVGIWYGISVVVSRSSPASRLSSWHKIRIFQVSPRGASLVRSSRVENMCGYDPFCYLTMSFWARCPMEPSPVGAEGSDRASESSSEVGSLVGFSLGGPGSGVGPVEVGLLSESSLLDSYG